MIERTYTIKQPYINHNKFEPCDDTIPGMTVRLKGEVKDLGDRVSFSDGNLKYVVVKGGIHWVDGDEEPILDHFDWGNIFRIRAIANNKPFYDDILRCNGDRKLYYLDGIKNDINNLLDFEGDMVYCGEGNRYVNICPVHCYTGIQFATSKLFVFDVATEGNYYFI